MRSDLFFGWVSLKLLFEYSDRRLDLFCSFPLLTRSPIEITKTVENSAPYFVLSIGFQLHILRRIVAIDRRYETEDASGDQVVEADRDRNTFVDATGNELHLRQVFKDQLLA